jgi:phenylpyruvate tautomerase PptA (4-oxalocrotonate tautomerase family)
MPMIDVYAATGTFAAKKELTRDLTAAMMRWEGVPRISLFKDNTAAFIHELEPDALGNANADSNYVRVQVLTPVGVLSREKQLGVVKEMTEIVATAAADPSLVDRTWSGGRRVRFEISPTGPAASRSTEARPFHAARPRRGSAARRTSAGARG